MSLRAKAVKGDVRAAEVILDRAYGKAKQTTDMNISGVTIRSFTIVSPDEQSDSGK